MAYTVASDEAFDEGMKRIKNILESYMKAHNISPATAESVKSTIHRRRRAGTSALRPAAAAAH